MLHPECGRVFRRGKEKTPPEDQPLRLHRHQHEEIEAASTGASYVLTTGTGSGKSLAYFVPTIDHVLRHGSRRGIKAIVVYPMNALCNSQMEELRKFLIAGYGDGTQPVTFERYTGQESREVRERIAANPRSRIESKLGRFTCASQTETTTFGTGCASSGWVAEVLRAGKRRMRRGQGVKRATRGASFDLDRLGRTP